MSGMMKIKRQFNIEQNQKMNGAVSNGHCAIFCEENSSFCCGAEVFAEYLWIIREAAAAVNSGAY